MSSHTVEIVGTLYRQIQRAVTLMLFIFQLPTEVVVMLWLLCTLLLLTLWERI